MTETQILSLIEGKDKLIYELQAIIDKLTEDKLHLNEPSFDFNREKFVDECAIKVAGSIYNHYAISHYNDYDKDCHIARRSYDVAEAMLKEKLERKNDK